MAKGYQARHLAFIIGVPAWDPDDEWFTEE
jgi:hypothetical protein